MASYRFNHTFRLSIGHKIKVIQYTYITKTHKKKARKAFLLFSLIKKVEQ